MSVDWNAVGQAAGLIGTGIVTFLLGRGRRKAADSVVEANARTEVSIADAEGTLYERLKEDVRSLSDDVKRMRDEIANERRRSRRLEDHIRRLEGAMRRAGIEPPPFDFEAAS
jgi:ATP-dependent protease HslVU (ClpYQ) peptidase subunit